MNGAVELGASADHTSVSEAGTAAGAGEAAIGASATTWSTPRAGARHQVQATTATTAATISAAAIRFRFIDGAGGPRHPGRHGFRGRRGHRDRADHRGP